MIKKVILITRKVLYYYPIRLIILNYLKSIEISTNNEL